MIAGVFGHTLFLRLPAGFQEFEPYAGKEVLVQGVVFREPQMRNRHTQLTVRPAGFDHSVLVFADTFSSVQYGDEVAITGILEKPPEFDDFNYREYLETKGIGALMRNSDVDIVRQGKYPSVASWAYAGVLKAKQRFRDVISYHVSPPESAVLKALLLGDQGALQDSLKDKLNKTGLRHVVAISGQHIVILTNMVVPLLLAFGLWRKHAIIGAFLCMAFFILLTGAEASAVRSGIMGGILLLGQYLGRTHDSVRILAFAALLMLLENPLLLTRDAGFQLSFLATLGIILLYPLFRTLFSRVPHALGMRDMLAMNAAAQVLTLPVLVYNFGYVSLVGFLTNALVLPAVPLLLGLGFIFLLAGAAWSVFGFLFSFPVVILTKYLVYIVELFSSLPFSTLAAEGIPVFLFLLLYVPFLFACWRFSKAYEFRGPWYTV